VPPDLLQRNQAGHAVLELRIVDHFHFELAAAPAHMRLTP
jgi:hypothetical protein